MQRKQNTNRENDQEGEVKGKRLFLRVLSLSMNCLLAAATPFEIGPFMDMYRSKPALLPEHVQLDICITGIGLVASAFHLQKQIQLKRPDLVIQAGIAGCFDKQKNLGEVLVIKQDLIADQ